MADAVGNEDHNASFRCPALTVPVAHVFRGQESLGVMPVQGERRGDGSLLISTGMLAVPLDGLTICFSLREAMDHEP